MSEKSLTHFFKDKQSKGTIINYNVDHRTIQYLMTGERNDLPLILFIHGSPGSLSAFIDFMGDTSLLNAAQLIAVDRPGFGASDFGKAEPSLQRQAALIKPIIEKHKLNRKVLLVGHSLGGPLIARMAMDYGELIDGLVFIAPSIDPELEPKEWYRKPMASPMVRWLLPRSLKASNDELLELKKELVTMLPLWKNIKQPSIIIQGKNDSLVPWQNALFAENKLRHTNLKIKMLDGVNHFIPWSHPQLVNEAIHEMIGVTKENPSK